MHEEERRKRAAASQRKYYRKNRQRLLEYSREHRHKNLEYYADHQRRWQREHPEYQKELRQKNPIPYQEQSRKRRARLRNATIGSEVDLRDYVTMLSHDPCAYCGNPASEIDHIVPLAEGGHHTWDNLTSACKSCNSAKRTHSLLSFLGRKP